MRFLWALMSPINTTIEVKVVTDHNPIVMPPAMPADLFPTHKTAPTEIKVLAGSLLCLRIDMGASHAHRMRNIRRTDVACIRYACL